MNPIVTVKDNGVVTYQLTEEDQKLLNRLSLIEGAGDTSDALLHKVCIMQAVSMVTTEAEARKTLRERWKRYQKELRGPKFSRRPVSPITFSDHPICVSEVITNFLVKLNDSAITNNQRNQLKKLIPDIINTCPIKTVELKTKTVERRSTTDEYRAVEKARKAILKRANPDIYGLAYETGRIPFTKRLASVREAAALLRTDKP